MHSVTPDGHLVVPGLCLAREPLSTMAMIHMLEALAGALSAGLAKNLQWIAYNYYGCMCWEVTIL